ncbi:hypothetical protein [Actinomadura rupiterrae]|uniref:hypothetical protein n=1 Tax=Actinomadura rupiterrae TaxID=559627 RepID=UPI0020A37213|nr:hypothetical protein [Actinomadura rupiterrae]MCP2340425.1 hypothetical protein [Actinomadura rupiterrae]
MPTGKWLKRVDEASGRVLVLVAALAGIAAALALLASLGLVVAGVVHALVPYWPYVLGGFGLVVVLPMTITWLEARFERPSSAPSMPSGGSGPIDWHGTTSYRCRTCGHNWTSHGHGRGHCTVLGPPYLTETTVGWEGDIIETTSGTYCDCTHYIGIEPD